MVAWWWLLLLMLTGDHWPPSFRSRVQEVFTRIFRLYAHIYTHHRADIEYSNLLCYMSGVFRNFIYFCHEFQLVDPSEMAPLQTVIEAIMADKCRGL